MHILALEISTTSAKAMLYDTKTSAFHVKVQELHSKWTDAGCHDAQEVYQQLMNLGRSIVQGVRVDRISLCTTWHSLLLCDKDMKPLTPVYLWCYRGAAHLCAQLRNNQDYVNAYYQKTGCMVHASYPFFKIQSLKEQGVDAGKCYVIGQGEYLNYRLTEGKMTTACMASGTGFMNIHTCAYDESLLEQVGIRQDQLFTIVDSHTSMPLGQKAADELGIPAGIPVVLSNADGGLNQIGAGGRQEGVMTLSVGTSGAMRMSASSPQLTDLPGTWCYLSPAGWLRGAATSGACNCIDWIRQTMLASDTSYDALEQGIEEGQNTPIFLPFLFGERCPGWDDERTGGFYEVVSAHSSKDFYRAVQEGVLFNLYQCYQLLCEKNGIPKKIRLSGGILHSEVWSQMCADLFGVDLEVDTNEHGSLLGAVAVAMDDNDNLPVRIERVIHPREEMKQVYEEKYQKYLRVYEREKTR